jgi:hypothetical protein
MSTTLTVNILDIDTSGNLTKKLAPHILAYQFWGRFLLPTDVKISRKGLTTMEKSQDSADRNGFVPIQIDHKPYKAPKPSMTGGEIRRLPEPDIAADRDLFRVVPGPSDDVKIGDNEIVQLEPGMHFYSAPKTINPGDSTDAIA